MSLLARLFPWATCLVLGLIIWGLQNQLTAERAFRSSVQAQLHAPNNKPETLSAYLTGSIEAKDLATTLLEQINKDALAAEKRSEAADAALAQVQQGNTAKLASIQSELLTLKTKKSSGNAAVDCGVIEEDSKLPWKGWHQ